jgi:spore coat polysaccharide biosynthesis predicted glycosyltransferase SpsG
VSPTALLVADAGPESGLGHLSRLSAIAVALRCRGVEPVCRANGATEPLERDGVHWSPWAAGDSAPGSVDTVILDSYDLDVETVAEHLVPLVLMHDHGDIPRRASLVVSAGAPHSDDRRHLTGLEYAALRPAYWGLPPREPGDAVRRILVTTGGGQSSELGLEIAQSVASVLPAVHVALVRGPHSQPRATNAVEVIDAPDSLVGQQLAADLVICGGGQTMLETAACGTPCVSLVLAENQRPQAHRLASHGGAWLGDPPEVAAVTAAVNSLVADNVRRRELGRRAQRAVDGYGALRVAFHVDALVRQAL